MLLSRYDKVIKEARLSFYTNCNTYSYCTVLKEAWIFTYKHQNLDIILGLDFILQNIGSLTINKGFIQISRYTINTPIIANQSCVEKRGGTLENKLENKTDNCNCEYKGGCKNFKFLEQIEEQLIEEDMDHSEII